MKNQSNSKQEKDIEDYIHELVTKQPINGVISIESGNDVLFNRAYGMASFEYEVPNTLDTKFLIGSNTKLFTAVAVLQLVEQNKLSLDTQVLNYFPKFRSLIDETITVHHLLSHTAGIIDFLNLDFFDSKIPFISQYIEIEDDLLLKAIFTESTYQIGDYDYSNSGYYILGIIIEKITGLSYTDYLTQNIFNILDMSDSGLYNQKLIVKKLASGYKLKDKGMAAASYWEMKKCYSCGGIYSTISDINKWLEGLSENRIITPESFQKIMTPVRNSYGYGCGIGEDGADIFICHDGFIKGHYSHVRLYPSLNIKMQILRNSSAYGSKTEDELDPKSVCSNIAKIIGIASV